MVNNAVDMLKSEKTKIENQICFDCKTMTCNNYKIAIYRKTLI